SRPSAFMSLPRSESLMLFDFSPRLFSSAPLLFAAPDFSSDWVGLMPDLSSFCVDFAPEFSPDWVAFTPEFSSFCVDCAPDFSSDCVDFIPDFSSECVDFIPDEGSFPSRFDGVAVLFC